MTKPFLKWAGNKYQIIDKIKSVLPNGNRLIEPFVGSGAVFLNTEFKNYLLADFNHDLIHVYLYLQADGKKFIADCKKYFDGKYNHPEIFYELRSTFNTTNNDRLKSALFVYLNKHCFNGLCRYNSKGEFNTPYGKYEKSYFPEKEMNFFHEKSQNAIIKHADFPDTFLSAENGDIVYCDPPYVPLSKTANFTSYRSGVFGEEQQKKLAKLAEELAAKSIPVIISNHHTEFTQVLYRKANIQTFDVQRYISCKGENRSKVAEVLAIFS
jgi:DNA adenine methylase